MLDIRAVHCFFGTLTLVFCSLCVAKVEAAPTARATSATSTKVSSLSVITSNGELIARLGQSYRLNASSEKVSVEGKLSGPATGILFYVNGKLLHDDQEAPYTLTKPGTAGLTPWYPAPGRYRVVVKPYTLRNSRKILGVARESVVTVSGNWNIPTATPTVTPQPTPPASPTATPNPATTDLNSFPEVALPIGGESWSRSFPVVGNVTIPAGRTVVLDVPTVNLENLVVLGTLVCGANDTAMTAKSLMVHGRFICGSRTFPHAHKLTITLKGASSDPSVMGMGTAVFGVMDGVLSLHGASAGKVSWTRLAKSAVKGATTLELTDTPGWVSGDIVAIASSGRSQRNAERVTVSSVNGNLVSFSPPLQFDHLASVKQYGEHTVDMRPEVGLLSRNIVIKGTDTALSSRFGGHTMFMGSSTIQLRGVELTALGQLNLLGRYPIHFHLMGDNCKSCYIADTSVHTTVQRGIVLHGTHGVLVQNNVVYNTVGHNIVAEDSDTWGNSLDRNLAFVNTSVALTEATLASQNDKNAANFWFKSSGNVVSNNVAGGSETNGFSYDDTAWSSVRDTIVMKQNVAHSIEASMRADPRNDFPRVGGLMLVACNRNMPSSPQIEGLTIYQSEIGVWTEECNSGTEFGGPEAVDPSNFIGGFFHLRNVKLAANYGSHLFPLAFTDTKLVDSLFAGGPTGADPLHVQYGSDVTTVNTTFADYGTNSISSGNDTDDPWSVTFTYASPKFINTAKDALLRPEAPEGSIVNLLDSSVYPAGSYVMEGDYSSASAADPQLCQRRGGVEFEPGEFGPDHYVCPLFVPQHARLRIHNGANSTGDSIFSSATVKRSDGLSYGTRNYQNHAIRVLVNSQYSYEVSAEPRASVFSIEAKADSMYPLAQSDSIVTSVPLAKAPSLVRRGRKGLDELALIANLAPTRSYEEFSKNRANSYFYDGRLLHVAASENIIEVRK